MTESHCYYINKGKDEDALKILKQQMSDEDAEKELKILKYERQFFFSDKVTFTKKFEDLWNVY